MTVLAWVFGFFVGIYVTMVTTMVVLRSVEKADEKKAFVEKLIKKEGWEGARWELQTSFGNSYMKVWKKLRKEYFANGNK